MKQNRFFSILLLAVIGLQTFAIFGVSETVVEVNYWDKYSVLASQFKPSLSSPLPNNIYHQIGSPNVVRFTPLQAQKINESYVLYRAEVVFSFEFTIATVYDMASLPIQSDNFDAKWATLFFCTRFNRAKDYVIIQPSGTKSYSYDPGDFYWSTATRVKSQDVYMYEPSITITSRKLAAYPNFGYAGDLEFDLKFEFDDRVRDFGDAQIKMTRKAFIARAEQSRIVSVSEYENPQISEYNSQISARITPSAGGNGQSALQSKIDELQLGVTAGSESFVTIIEGQSIAAPRGSILQNANTVRGIKLYPNVLEKKQQINIRYGKLDIDTQDEFLFGANVDPAGVSRVYGAPTTDTRQRTLGYEIKNRGQLYTIETTFILESLNQVEVLNTQEPVPLAPINQTRDVYYWDNYVEGTIEISPSVMNKDWTPGITSFINWFYQWWWLILTIGVIIGTVSLILYIKLSTPEFPGLRIPKNY